MKDIITHLNKAFDNRIRLGIMSVLVVNEWVEFNTLKELLELTDGNLASHISALEKEKYIEVRKQFVGKKPQTTYRVSETGKKAFNDHLDALETILKLRT
jgi:DNA-binding PadR family transcriptional regulator